MNTFCPSGTRAPAVLVAAVITLVLLAATSQAQWIQTSGPTGLRPSRALAVDQRGAFLGIDQGGVFHSSSHGRSWEFRGDGLTMYDQVLSIAASGDTAWAGFGGRGAFYSTDRGLSWAPASIVDTTVYGWAFTSLAVQGQRVFAVYRSGSGVLYRSENLGRSWETCTPAVGSGAVCVSSCGSLLLAGTQTGLYQSSDSGRAWLQAPGGPTGGPVLSIAHEGSTIVAGTVGGIVFSTDGGQAWVTRSAVLSVISVSSIAVRGSAIFAASNVDGIYRSSDFGLTWTSVNAGLPTYNIYAMAFYGDTLLVCTRTGVFRSGDLGATWLSVSDGLVLGWAGYFAAQGPFVVASMAYGDSACVYRTTDQGNSWIPSPGGVSVGGPFVSNGVVLLGTYAGGACISTDSGATWIPSTNQGLFASSPSAYCAQGNIIYAASGNQGGVCRSTNNGYTWRPKYSGLTTLNITSLAVDGAAIYAGSVGQAEFFRTLDSGLTWEQRAVGVTDYVITGIVAKGPVILAGGPGGIYRSNDSGATWSPANQGINLGLGGGWGLVKWQDVVFASGWEGIAVSEDWGLSWRMANEGLGSRCQAGSILVDPPYVYVSTQYAGVWRRPLSELIVTGTSEEPAVVPSVFLLHQNYPNPFNSSTTVRYSLPSRSHVTLTVFNTLGQQVATLVQGDQEVGYHEVQFDASGLSSGVYLYRLTAGSIVETKKMAVMK
jgi:photosystem II stability/assembly factor-like uncharacterized protein